MTYNNNSNITPNRALVPDYLSIDYDTFAERNKQILKNTEQFKDYNYEGSNISLLIQWNAYLAELGTYYANKIAKNIYDDTTDLYENAHRLASHKGYNARGYISSIVDVNITINVYNEDLSQNFAPGDQLYIPAYTPVFAELEDSKKIQFITTRSFLVDVPYDDNIYVDGSYTFPIPFIQGQPFIIEHKGKDLIDNKLILPFYKFNHDFTDSDTHSTCLVEVNNEAWTRVSNFHEHLSNLSENNITDKVFMLMFNKYKQYVVEFSNFRQVPEQLDTIKITLLRSAGEEGNVGANTINILDEVDSAKIIYNNTKKHQISLNAISISNESASYGGTNPQEINQITNAGKGNMHSQERCVTRKDYNTYLKSRSDIISANVWGEREVNLHGNVTEYNKIHVSLIPSAWGTGTISVTPKEWTPASKTGSIDIPTTYNDAFKEDIKVFLEPRKILTTYEEFDLPDLVYFMFRIGLKIKRTYNFPDVAEAVRDKIKYYFSAKNRQFNENISFMNLHNYVLDVYQIAEGHDWSLIKGIDNLIFREIVLSSPTIDQAEIDKYKELGITIASDSNIYPPNKLNNFPQYTQIEFMDNIENKLKVIKLGFNQFPYLASDLCIFEEERGY